MQRLILLISILFCYSFNVWSQSITWGPANPAGSANSLEVYNGNDEASFEFTNDALGLKNVNLRVDMGTGILYDGGFSFNSSSAAVLTPLSNIGDSPAIFLIDTLAPGEQITLVFDRRATCESRVHKISGGTFEDTLNILLANIPVNYSNNGGNPFEAEYDVTYGNIIIGAINHSPSASAGIGETLTRSYNVRCYFSIQYFYFHDCQS